MNFDLVVSAAAYSDMESAAIWYEDQSQGLGHKFLQEVKDAFKRIQASPERYPLAESEKKSRFHFLKSPFRSYKIIYQFTGKAITIIAVFHSSQNPNIWQARN